MPTATCDYCGRPADWRRPPTKAFRNEGFRCDAHAPDWRVAEFEALTLVARSRGETKDRDDLPRPMAPEKAEPKTPKAVKMPPPNKTKAEIDAMLDRAVAKSRQKKGGR